MSIYIVISNNTLFFIIRNGRLLSQMDFKFHTQEKCVIVYLGIGFSPTTNLPRSCEISLISSWGNFKSNLTG